MSVEECTVLAVEALEREVNNGGYSQFFINSAEFVPLVVASLARIGCVKTAEVTERAISELKLSRLSTEEISRAMESENEDRDTELGNYDDLYYNSGDDIAGQLFAFIKTNQAAIKLK